MKITLDASIKEHREVAELFRGSEIGHSKAVFKRIGPTAYLIGVDSIKGGFWSNEFIDRHPFRSNKVIIDLDTAQMDLRMAIGTDIEFDYYGQLVGCEIPQDDLLYFHFQEETIYDNKTLFKLCPDYLKRIGVKVEE